MVLILLWVLILFSSSTIRSVLLNNSELRFANLKNKIVPASSPRKHQTAYNTSAAPGAWNGKSLEWKATGTSLGHPGWGGRGIGVSPGGAEAGGSGRQGHGQGVDP